MNFWRKFRSSHNRADYERGAIHQNAVFALQRLIEFPERGVGEMIDCPLCGEKIELVLPKPESKDTDTSATCGCFDVIETRHFITLTERGSNRIFRIPVSDAMVVRLAGPTWRTGDVVKLSEQEQSRLEDSDARCREMGMKLLSGKTNCRIDMEPCRGSWSLQW